MNLENLNLVELNAQEKKETDGGDGGIILTLIGMSFGAMAWAYAEGKEMGHAIGSRL